MSKCTAVLTIGPITPSFVDAGREERRTAPADEPVCGESAATRTARLGVVPFRDAAVSAATSAPAIRAAAIPLRTTRFPLMSLSPFVGCSVFPATLGSRAAPVYWLLAPNAATSTRAPERAEVA
jgi:hypothetical protein